MIPFFVTNVILPLIVTHFLVGQRSWWLRVPCDLVSIPCFMEVSSRLSLLAHAARARLVGARTIPLVQSGTPMGLGTLRRNKKKKSGIVSRQPFGHAWVVLSRRYGKTFNTRVLGQDQVRQEMLYEVRL